MRKLCGANFQLIKKIIWNFALHLLILNAAKKIMDEMKASGIYVDVDTDYKESEI